MNIKPLQDFIIVRIKTETKSTGGGIYIPEATDKEPINTGTVISVGEKVNLIKEGDQIMFRPYAFEEIVVNEEKLLFGKQDAIIALIV